MVEVEVEVVGYPLFVGKISIETAGVGVARPPIKYVKMARGSCCLPLEVGCTHASVR